MITLEPRCDLRECRYCHRLIIWAEGIYRPLEAFSVPYKYGCEGAVLVVDRASRRLRYRLSGDVWPEPRWHSPRHWCREYREPRRIGEVLAAMTTCRLSWRAVRP